MKRTLIVPLLNLLFCIQCSELAQLNIQKETVLISRKQHFWCRVYSLLQNYLLLVYH